VTKQPKPYMGVYESIDFPEYKYQEYPKMLYLKEKDEHGNPKQKIVYNQAEELRAIDEIVPIKDYNAVAEEKRKLEEQLAIAQKQLEGLTAQKPAEEAKPASPTIKVPSK
jgi:ribosomal protein L5